MALRNEEEIEKCFGGCESVDQVLERLSMMDSAWAREIEMILKGMCPLSLKVREN